MKSSAVWSSMRHQSNEFVLKPAMANRKKQLIFENVFQIFLRKHSNIRMAKAVHQRLSNFYPIIRIELSFSHKNIANTQSNKQQKKKQNNKSLMQNKQKHKKKANKKIKFKHNSRRKKEAKLRYPDAKKKRLPANYGQNIDEN